MISRLQILVVAGPHQGASMCVPDGDTVSIGSLAEHRLWLRDPSIGDSAVCVQIDLPDLQIEVLSGSVLVNEERLMAAQTCRAHEEALLQLGDSCLQFVALAAAERAPDDNAAVGTGNAAGNEATPLQCAAAESGTAMAAAATERISPEPVEDLPATQIPASEDAIPARTPSGSSERVYGLLARAGLSTAGALLLGVAIAGTGLLHPSDDPVDGSDTLAARLAASGFDEVQIQAGVRPPVVMGFVATREQSLQLDALLRQEPGGARSRVTVGEELARRVQDVFRLHGVEVEVTVPAAGEAYATSRFADEAVLQQAIAQARQDIPQLTRLELDNTPPPVPIKPPEAAPEIPGKRVALVVSDEPAHVVTEDRSRYFVGSVLPSGHRITAISAGRVSLVRAGQHTDLQF